MSTSFHNLTRQRWQKERSTSQRHSHAIDEHGFECKHCGGFVATILVLSGVHNRNHCPYCLWSRHMDWQKPGDRFSACKSPMRPIGLTVKCTHKKYTSTPGELMLVHQCAACDKLSINRIAADDDARSILSVFRSVLQPDNSIRILLEANGIQLLSALDLHLVLSRLFGNEWNLSDGSLLWVSL